MKTKQLLPLLLLFMSLFFLQGCSKDDALAENQKNIKKNWKLDRYLINSVDKTGALTITAYSESYTDNQKYDRSFNNQNGNKITQNGAWEFEHATRLKISGVGSVQMTSNGTVSSSYYDIIRLNDTELWYSFVNGGNKHEFRLIRN